MTYLDPVHRDISELAERQRAEDGRFVFLASRQRVPLRTRIGGEGPAPEGAVPVDVHRRDTDARLGRFAADPASADELRELFTKPRRVGLGVHEEPPGLVGHLVALIPVDELEGLAGDDQLPGGPGGGLPGPGGDGAAGGSGPGGGGGDLPWEGEPDWKESVPEPPELGEGPDLGGAERPAPGEDEEARFGALHLGNVVRFSDDREHPGDFVDEARDVFRTALEGDLPSISERLMEELAAASLDE